jgi:thioesterase domain-containing protein
LFLVHPVGGTVSAYTPLGQELAAMFTVYGLESPALDAPSTVAPSLAALVTDYTHRIRAAQPAAPYRLAGWSMGAVLAFEIAQRLEQQGAEVRLLVLLDPPFAVPADFAPAEPLLAGRFVADAIQSLGQDTGLPDPAAPDPAADPDPAAPDPAADPDLAAPDPATAAAPDPATPAPLDPATAAAPDPAAATAGQLAWLAGRLAGHDGDPAALDAMAAGLRRRFDLFAAHSRMLAGYRPASPAVRAPTLIVSADHSPNAPARSRWPDLLDGPVSVISVDSDHYAFLRRPMVAEVGAAIRDRLAGLRSSGGHANDI